MKGLDLVVTVDSAIAHLAGALGVPVWVALPFGPDWRWQLERDNSPWYSTMRLFRQSQYGDWRSVFQSMTTKLRQVVGQLDNEMRKTIVRELTARRTSSSRIPL